jgi:hypothetical protein
MPACLSIYWQMRSLGPHTHSQTDRQTGGPAGGADGKGIRTAWAGSEPVADNATYGPAS